MYVSPMFLLRACMQQIEVGCNWGGRGGGGGGEGRQWQNTAPLEGRQQSLDWTGGLDWWTGLVDWTTVLTNLTTKMNITLFKY